MTRADDYRRRAEEADERARQTRDPEAKRTFHEVARQWRDLADQVEQTSQW